MLSTWPCPCPAVFARGSAPSLVADPRVTLQPHQASARLSAPEASSGRLVQSTAAACAAWLLSRKFKVTSASRPPFFLEQATTLQRKPSNRGFVVTPLGALWGRRVRWACTDHPRAAHAASDAAAPPATSRQQYSKLKIWILVVLFMLGDISVFLVGTQATKKHVEATLLFTAASISAVMAIVMSWRRLGQQGVRDCFDIGKVVSRLPVAMCFTIASHGLLRSMGYFDGSFIKLLGQMKLPLTTLLSFLVLGRRYTWLQWQSIILVCSATICFTAQRMGASVGNATIPGFMWVMAWVVFNALGTILAERVLKAGHGVGFYPAVAHLRFGEMISNVTVLTLFTPGSGLGDWFGGWDRTTLFLMAALVCDQWLTSLMVERLSSVTKNVTKCLTMASLYTISVVRGSLQFTLAEAVGAGLIVQSTALFGTASGLASKKRP